MSASRHQSDLLFLVSAVHLDTAIRIRQPAFDIPASLPHAFTGHTPSAFVNGLVTLMQQLKVIRT